MTVVSLIQGRAWRLGPNIDTDAILPANYMNLTDPQELGRHCLEGLDPDFPRKLLAGDLLVAGSNFGCGSSREHAPLAIKAAGVGAVVAASFARIFYRNALNIGLPIVECPEVVEAVSTGDRLKIDLAAGLLLHLEKGTSYRLPPFPPFMQELIAVGGLMNYVMRRTKR